MTDLLILLSNEYNNRFSLEIIPNIFSFFFILFGIYIIYSKNPIVSVFFLIGLFLAVSLNLIFLGYNFLGLSYLLVYVGAVSIIFLYILMLINVRISELLDDTSNNKPLAVFTGYSLGIPLFYTLSRINLFLNKYFILNLFNIEKKEKINKPNFRDHEDFDINKESTLNFSALDIQEKQIEDLLYYVTSNIWDNNLMEIFDITSIGNIIYSTYSIWLIIGSVILLLAMVGALTITKKENSSALATNN